MNNGTTGSQPDVLLSELAGEARRTAKRFAAQDDWMSRANAESALALSRLASDAEAYLASSQLNGGAGLSGSPRQVERTHRSVTVRAPEVEELKAPLLAALGAADLALATVNDQITNLRDRAEETRGRVEESRARLSKLQEDLPEQLTELREWFAIDELRKAAQAYLEAATSRYNKLIERGEAALERLRSQSGLDDVSQRAEGYVDQAVELTQEALGIVASQTREVGERAAKLVGIELPKKAEAAQKAVAKKAPAKKAAAKKAPARKVTQK